MHHASPSSSKTARRICLPGGPHAYTSITTDWRGYLPASPHRLATTGSGPTHTHRSSRKRTSRHGWLVSPASPGTRTRGYGNINPLSIDYACRPRLRSRLTLGGTTWPRNPWSSGGRDSHSAFATHACILTPTPSTTRSRDGFTGCRTLPYPPTRLHPPRTNQSRRISCAGDTASAVCLSPATLSAQNHLTSELLRTLSRMAASKPTSWLSQRLHILSH